jgi:NAD+ synthase (glutamine-hydrolysing)
LFFENRTSHLHKEEHVIGKKIRALIAQMECVPGNVAENLNRMLDAVITAGRNRVDIVVFPEFATTGYMLGDRWENDDLIREAQEANDRLRRASKGMTLIFGSVVADWEKIGQDGRVRKYNAAMIAQNGEWVSNTRLKGWVPKSNLPKYRIFDDARHFYPAGLLADEMGIPLSELLHPFNVFINDERLSIALAICEDLWEDEYNDKPSKIYGAQGADLIVDISCSPWTYGKWHAREGMLARRVADSGIPILYVNAVGLENNTKNLIWFDGDSSLIGADGKFRWRGQQHKEQLHMLDFDDLGDPLPERDYLGIAEIHDALVAAHRAFYRTPKVVVGLSGGIDSAVAAALLTEALGPGKVLAINMPSKFNSATTQDLAEACARNLGIEYRVAPIQGVHEAHLELLRGLGYANPKGLTRENDQARIRSACVLAAVAQEENGLFTCNGNKTEMALNYFTMYGDGAGAAAFLADLWKGQIYELARFINERARRELIPQGIIDVVPSAELSVDQNVDEGKGDPIFYPYHDKLLRAFTEQRLDPATILEYAVSGTLEERIGCEPGTIARYFKTRTGFVENLEWAWRQYNVEFKRGQTPPVFLASRRAFGFDRRDTIAAGYLTRRYQEYKQVFLSRDLVAL